MHEAMTGTTKPGDVLQVAGAMPAPLDSFRVHEARDEMVVGQIDPVASADLAGVGARGARRRRRGPQGREERRQDGREEFRGALPLRIGDPVGRQGVGYARVQEAGEGGVDVGACEGEGVLVACGGRVVVVVDGFEPRGEKGECFGRYVLCEVGEVILVRVLGYRGVVSRFLIRHGGWLCGIWVLTILIFVVPVYYGLILRCR